mmetsp:Transcript_3250/g.4323  ORF Transcript_3250/g.4323 Transcript_3250/m.4323 type:complete len:412 (+) Transcript_3250:31-1266(+)
MSSGTKADLISVANAIIKLSSSAHQAAEDLLSSSSSGATTTTSPTRSSSSPVSEEENRGSISPSALSVTSHNTNQSLSPPKKDKHKFPVKLMLLLDSVGKYDDIIAWLPNGDTFIIHKPDLFEEKVLREYFLSDGKLNSFCRKLYRWGFAKCSIYSTNKTPAYAHKKFKRGNLTLCKEIVFVDQTRESSKISNNNNNPRKRSKLVRRGHTFCNGFYSSGKRSGGSAGSKQEWHELNSPGDDDDEDYDEFYQPSVVLTSVESTSHHGTARTQNCFGNYRSGPPSSSMLSYATAATSSVVSSTAYQQLLPHQGFSESSVTLQPLQHHIPQTTMSVMVPRTVCLAPATHTHSYPQMQQYFISRLHHTEPGYDSLGNIEAMNARLPQVQFAKKVRHTYANNFASTNNHQTNNHCD